MTPGIIASLFKALSDLTRPGVAKYIAYSVALTLVGLGLSLWGGLSLFDMLTGRIETPWLAWVAEAMGWILGLFVTALLFVPVLGMVGALFAEPIAGAVEAAEYPALPAIRDVGIGESIAEGLRFFRLVLVANLLALPLYLIPGVNVLTGLAVNGWLIGREYFMLVAARRYPAESVLRIWTQERARLVGLGVLLAACAFVPVLNLFVPAIATCAMVHQAAALSKRLHETPAA